MIDVSIIIAVYFNEGSLEKTLNSIHDKVINQKRDKVFEIICIDDGSKDNSLNEILSLKEKYKTSSFFYYLMLKLNF